MRLNLVFLFLILLNSILYVKAGPGTGLLACATCCGIANCPALLIPGGVGQSRLALLVHAFGKLVQFQVSP